MSVTKVFSQADNLSPLTSSVNPRTGGVDISIPLADLSSGLKFPAAFSLCLLSKPGQISLDAHTIADIWTLNVPRIDTRAGVIYFSDGSIEKYDPTANRLVYRRLDNCKIEKVFDSGSSLLSGYVITHKNGTVEYMNYGGQLTKIVSASGHFLDFIYEDTGASYESLMAVNDGLGNSININRSGSDSSSEKIILITKTVSRVVVATTRIVLEQVDIQSYRLKSVSLPNNEALTTRFEYIESGNELWVSKIITPNGKVQKFTYNPIPCSNTDFLQVVSLLEVTGEHQAAAGDRTTISYEYSPHNYTGYSSSMGGAMLPNTDNCILRTDNYHYTVTEKHSDIQYIREYNRFHLLVSETCKNILDNGIRSVKTFTYSLVSRADIYEQPSNYSLWWTSSTEYRNINSEGEIESRILTESRIFDSQGNLLNSLNASGIETFYDYYPSSGEPGHCPPDPGQFVNYIKRIRTRPSDAPVNTDVKLMEFRYASVAGLPYSRPEVAGSRIANMVLVMEEKQNGLVIRSHEYVDAEMALTTHRIFVGLLAKEFVGTSYVKNHYYALSGQEASIRTEQVASTLSLNNSKIVDITKGLVLREVDFNGATTIYTHDDLKRITSKTDFAGTEWARTECYTYETYQYIDATYQYQNIVTITKPDGMRHISYINFNNLLSYSLEIPAGDTTPYCTRKIQYNSADLVIFDTEYDTTDFPNLPARTCVNETQYFYSMRQPSEIHFSNGAVQRLQKNLALNTERSQYQNKPAYIKQFNNSGLLVSLTSEINGIETVLERYMYDGFDRKKIVTHTSGGSDVFVYDLFDRVITKTAQGALDPERENITRYTYSSDIQNMHLAISLDSKTRLADVEDTILDSARTFDGFGRLIRQDNQRFIYDQPYFDTPSKVYYEGQEGTSYITETLDPVTSLVNTARIVDGGGSATFTHQYSRETGWPVVMSGDKVGYTYSYNQQGLPSRILTTHDSGADQPVTTQQLKYYSASGKRLQSTVNHMGLNEHYRYASNGDLIAKTYGGIGSVYIQYNPDGDIGDITFLSEKFARNLQDDDPVLSSMLFEYDMFGMENRRTTRLTKANGSTTMLEVENYHDNRKRLISRHIAKGAGSPRESHFYTYQSVYGKLKRSSINRDNVFESDTIYDFAGGLRFKSATESAKPAVAYTYHQDRPCSIRVNDHNSPIPADSMGNITDVDGRTIRYNAASRVAAVSRANATHDYFYEPSGRLSQIVSGNDRIIYLYDGDDLIGEICGDVKTLYLRVGEITIGRYIVHGTVETFELFATDSTGTVRCVKTFTPGNVGENEVSSAYYEYSDYGVRSPDVTSTNIDNLKLFERNTLGFNGCLFDAVSSTYILGNGYRPYSPTLKTFLAKDSLSPFGVAGVNRYQYCNLDPINNIDPSGHLSYSAQWGIGLGVAGILLSIIPVVGAIAGGTLLTLAGGLAIAGGVLGATSSALGIASYATEDNEELSKNLGYASLAFGVAAIGTSFARSAATFHQRAVQGIGGARSSAQTLGGVAYGPMEYYQKTSKLVAEGAPFVTQGSSGWLDSGGQLATRLRPILQGTGPVTLASCYSSVGGQYASQAQRLANVLNRSVTGFRGVTHPGTSMAGATTFLPQSGFAAARTNVLNTLGAWGMKAFLYGIR